MYFWNMNVDLEDTFRVEFYFYYWLFLYDPVRSEMRTYTMYLVRTYSMNCFTIQRINIECWMVPDKEFGNSLESLLYWEEFWGKNNNISLSELDYIVYGIKFLQPPCFSNIFTMAACRVGWASVSWSRPRAWMLAFDFILSVCKRKMKGKLIQEGNGSII